MMWPFHRRKKPAVTSSWLTEESARRDLVDGLKLLFGGWFHQDFDLESGNDEGVCKIFVRKTPTSYVVQTLGFLDALISTDWTDETLRSVILESGSYCDVTLVGESPRDWIVMLRDTIREELEIKTTDAASGK